MTSRVKRDRARQRLSYLLSIANDADFFQMIWCVDRMRDGAFELGARGLKNLPADLEVRLKNRDLYIQPWILEDLINEVLTVEKPKIIVPRQLACDSYDGFTTIYNSMLRVDDAESGFELSRGKDVLQAMPRYGHRQFDWQTGWLTGPSIYRSAFIYGQGACEAWFRETHGITPAEFILFAIAARSAFSHRPYASQAAIAVPELDLDQRIIEAAVALISGPLEELRTEAAQSRRGSLNIAARQSVLRRNPMISVKGRGLIAPLPDLISERATAGLYLDLVKAPSSVLNEMAVRFEQYAFDLLGRLFLDNIRREYEYGPRKSRVKTPDILIGPSDAVQMIIECKATRMRFAVKFSDDWHDETERGYQELAKGVGQIWRHCSHMRRGIVSDRPCVDLVGHVLTIDPWMRMTHDQDEIIFRKAKEWCAEADPLITSEDECPIGFSHIADLEALLHRTTAEGVLKVLRSATKKIGWGSVELGSEEEVEKVQRPYLLTQRLGEVLPWFDRLDVSDADF